MGVNRNPLFDCLHDIHYLAKPPSPPCCTACVGARQTYSPSVGLSYEATIASERRSFTLSLQWGQFGPTKAFSSTTASQNLQKHSLPPATVSSWTEHRLQVLLLRVRLDAVDASLQVLRLLKGVGGAAGDGGALLWRLCRR